MQGRSKEGSDASRLKKHHSQAIGTMYAVLSKSSAPLDLIVTDGMTFNLFRFREDRGVLVYHDLSGTEVGAQLRSLHHVQSLCQCSYILM